MNAGLHAHVCVHRGLLAVDAALDAAPGETVVLVGPNGAGKTTILHAIAGLLPLEAGTIVLGGTVLDDPDAGVFLPPEARPVGVVFQAGLLFEHMSVLDNIAFGLRARGTAKAAANERAIQLVARMGLSEYARVRPRELSGGQAQRVAIARALAPSPRALLLDEPLAALDATTRVEIRRVLRDEVATYDGVRVLVTHDPLEALTLGDRLVVVENGRVTQAGTPDELRGHPGTGYVAQLLGTNLLRGTLESADRFRLANDVVLHVAVEAPVLGPCIAVLEPDAVTLFASEPHASARNAWRATVADLDREPHRVRVRFDHPVPIVADVTRAAAAELALDPGVDVWCAVKATAIAVHPL